MSNIFDNIIIVFVACRISFRKFWQWLRCYQPVSVKRDQYQVICLGLSGAGKTSALAALAGEPLTNLEPTLGFNIKTIAVKNYILDIKELGGSETIRPFWERYFEGQHGILYVINAAADEETFKESAQVLSSVLLNKFLMGVPCVLLVTHHDIAGSRNHEEITHLYQGILSGRKWKIYTSSFQESGSILMSLETLVNFMTGVS